MDDNINTEANEKNKSRLIKLRGHFQSAKKDLGKGLFRIHAVTVEEVGLLSSNVKNELIARIVPVPGKARSEKESLLALNKFNPDFLLNTSNSHESWAPYYGTSKVTQSFTFQTLYFNSKTGIGSSSTYECETQVYNKNFADYDNYWSSNFPSAYYDTPFLDTLDNFTVGSASAISLSTYTQYYTYMSLRAGSASTATVRVKGQLGYRVPSYCYSTWCIFAQATSGSLAYFTAPISNPISWTY